GCAAVRPPWMLPLPRKARCRRNRWRGRARRQAFPHQRITNATSQTITPVEARRGGPILRRGACGRSKVGQGRLPDGEDVEADPMERLVIEEVAAVEDERRLL